MQSLICKWHVSFCVHMFPPTEKDEASSTIALDTMGSPSRVARQLRDRFARGDAVAPFSHRYGGKTPGPRAAVRVYWAQGT